MRNEVEIDGEFEWTSTRDDAPNNIINRIMLLIADSALLDDRPSFDSILPTLVAHAMHFATRN